MSAPKYKKEAYNTLISTLTPIIARLSSDGFRFRVEDIQKGSLIIRYNAYEDYFTLLFEDDASGLLFYFDAHPTQVFFSGYLMNKTPRFVRIDNQTTLNFIFSHLLTRPKLLYNSCKALYFKNPQTKTMYLSKSLGEEIVIKSGFLLGPDNIILMNIGDVYGNT